MRHVIAIENKNIRHFIKSHAFNIPLILCDIMLKNGLCASVRGKERSMKAAVCFHTAAVLHFGNKPHSAAFFAAIYYADFFFLLCFPGNKRRGLFASLRNPRPYGFKILKIRLFIHANHPKHSMPRLALRCGVCHNNCIEIYA